MQYSNKVLRLSWKKYGKNLIYSTQSVWDKNKHYGYCYTHKKTKHNNNSKNAETSYLPHSIFNKY